jgi:hypothetical protein
VASGYGLKPDQFAARRTSGHIEVVIRFRCRLFLEVLDPYLVSDISAAIPGSAIQWVDDPDLPTDVTIDAEVDQSYDARLMGRRSTCIRIRRVRKRTSAHTVRCSVASHGAGLIVREVKGCERERERCLCRIAD